MKRTNTDLMVGGAILLALFILVAGTLWLKEVSITSRMQRYTVLFPNVGSLQVGDPVKVNGVKMGATASISLLGTQVKVVMRVDRSVVLTDSATVTVQNIGLMGERNIMIQLSDKGSTYQPDNRRPRADPMLQGKFDSGIAEAVGKIGTVLDEVEVVVKDVQSIMNNTVGDTSFVIFFKTIVGRLDTISALAQDLIAANKGRVNESMANVQAITAEIKRLVEGNRENINTLLANGSRLSGQAVQVATEVESLSVSLGAIVSQVQRGQGTLGMLVSDDTFYRDLKATVGKIDTLASDVQDQGLKLRLRLGFRDRKRATDVMTVREVTVENSLGIHARPATKIIQAATSCSSSVTLEVDGVTADAKSIMSVMMLAAAYNAKVTIRASGADEAEAVEAIAELFRRKFDEE